MKYPTKICDGNKIFRRELEEIFVQSWKIKGKKKRFILFKCIWQFQWHLILNCFQIHFRLTMPSVPLNDFIDPTIRLALNSGLRQFELWLAQNWIEVPKWNDKNAGHVANCQLWNIDWPT